MVRVFDYAFRARHLVEFARALRDTRALDLVEVVNTARCDMWCFAHLRHNFLCLLRSRKKGASL
ncbi:MAG: hypothetical protein CMJ58_27660 [Planctomycetaceae bacterium]|nr:hypothetical protein [Planctomycetaceae bacterium]